MEVGNKEVYKFSLDSNLKKLYAKLFNYFHGIEYKDCCTEHGLNLNKGIALVGAFGVGKTTAMRVFHSYLKTTMRQNPNLFVISSVEDLINELQDKDWIKNKLAYNTRENSAGGIDFRPRHVLVNEFGYKYDIKKYGTNVNELIEAWLMKRYDIFQEHRKLVHITTNFGTKELKDNFPPKIVDRFREMFNFIELKGSSLRR